jgi:RNA polymerase sigma-32 factor
MATAKLLQTRSSLDQYFAEINRYPLLSRADEFELARRLKEEDDAGAAQGLVTANLRFVVKIAFEYRKYQVNMVDLIQEGNLGLMTAVRKFDPYRGYRLISYAVWWIKAYIQNFILRTWSLVKLGTTGEQRRMLFGSRKTEDSGELLDEEVSVMPAIASRSSGELMQLDTHIARRDFSLDTALDDSSRVSYVDLLRGTEELQDEAMGRAETSAIVREHLREVAPTLNERERYILENRTLSDEPMTLAEIGEHFRVTRERTRQIESNLKRKLARFISEFDASSAEVAEVG